MKKTDKNRNKAKWPLVLGIIAIILLAVAGGYFIIRQGNFVIRYNQRSLSTKTIPTKQSADTNTVLEEYRGDSFLFDYYKDWGFTADTGSSPADNCPGMCGSWSGYSQMPGFDYSVQDAANVGITAKVLFNSSKEAASATSPNSQKIKVAGVDAIKTVDTNNGNIGGYSTTAVFTKVVNDQTRTFSVTVYGNPKYNATIDQLFNTILLTWQWQ